MRPAVALLLFVCTLAGCAETPEDLDGLDADGSSGSDHGVPLGFIQGLALDETIAPVAGVTVSLPTLGRNTTTDEAGAFRFDDVEPGTHRVTATAPGFLPVETTAFVPIEGTGEGVSLVMRRAAPDWWVESFQIAGALESGGTLSVAGEGVISFACCSDYFWEYELERGRPDWAQTEAIWDATQPAAEHLSLTHAGGETCVEAGLLSGCSLDTYALADGPSPLLLASPGEEIVVEEERPVLIASLFPGESGPEGVVGVGATVDQGFEFFVHVFYGFTPDPGWSFVHDGAHPVPQE